MLRNPKITVRGVSWDSLVSTPIDMFILPALTYGSHAWLLVESQVRGSKEYDILDI